MSTTVRRSRVRSHKLRESARPRSSSSLTQDIVRTLVSAIDAKDAYTCGHSDRVARYAARLALELRCPPRFVRRTFLAGLVHDIGKIGIRDEILTKQGPLTDAEFEEVKAHPQMGCEILAGLEPVRDLLPAVLHHHERWDGRGYPYQLQGERIPRMARILAVADAFDAMRSDRPYRRGLSHSAAERILRDGAGTQWESAVVDACLAAREDMGAIGAETNAA